MRLEKASYKAIKYACLNFHYAKRVPSGANVAYSVFNDVDEWCGVIIYGYPATPKIAPELNWINGQLLELRRVALNSKHGITSQALAISLRLIKKDCPTLTTIITYSDKGQNHYGIIYQATNWVYFGESESSGVEFFINGKWVHSRHGKGQIKRKLPGKHKYVFPLTQKQAEICKRHSKQYPKKNADIA
jgi:hypothetical protein